jgi:hypothetical protein
MSRFRSGAEDIWNKSDMTEEPRRLGLFAVSSNIGFISATKSNCCTSVRPKRIAGVGLSYGSWTIQVYCFCVGRCMVQCVFRPGAGGGRLRLVAPRIEAYIPQPTLCKQRMMQFTYGFQSEVAVIVYRRRGIAA